MTLTASTKVHDLLKTHPFLEDFLASYDSKFEMLRNRMARATIGRLATLRTAAGIASLDLDAFLQAIAAEIEAKTGQRPEVERSGEESGRTRQQRVEELKAIIGDLHAGGDREQARERFAKAVEDVEASEIAAMEEDLIRGGLPVSEVQRLCDVHVGAFRQALDEHVQVEAPAGHPVHTYVQDNRILSRLTDQLGGVARAIGAGQQVEESYVGAEHVLSALGGLENHYQRKENQLFPILERHGVTGPSQVMWGVHNQIRAALKVAREAAASRNTALFPSAATALARDIVEMVYKEEKILLPLSLETLTEQEWVEVRRGEDELGYALARPAAAWPDGADAGQETTAPTAGLLALLTGALTLEQVNLVFTHLPVDLSFVDQNDEVRFYSEGPHRIFPRSPAVIGRKVQNCHPPKSVHIVQEILDAFRAGKRDEAEFWIELHGKFIHIQYFAVRDKSGAYRGCLEVSQDATRIRSLKGERRLLAWTDSQ
ncbi:MAG: DUF438 domain-containing protein [Deltaproteobacteria bacterium]|nr:DUF438 domain-containing protein [Deltaproteobacteria bacterium]